jgi:fimbrial isopeptide formation D2 family protein
MAVTRMLRATVAVVAAALVAALFSLAAPARALAAGQTGSLVVSAADGASTSLRAYQLFDADVTDGAEGKALSNIVWASADAKAAVEGAIAAQDASYAGATAQDAAEWLHSHVASGASATPVAGSVPAVVATRLAAGDADFRPLTAGKTAELAAGYWLVTGDPDAVGTGQAASAAILVAVGGGKATATTKAAVPTVEKSVREDSDDAWGKAADATVGDELDWRLEARVPAIAPAYDSYHVTFHDTLAAGIAKPEDVCVYVAAAGVEPWRKGADPDAASGWERLDASEFTCNYVAAADGTATLDVRVTDVLGSAVRHGMSTDGGLSVCVVYDAPLDSDAGHGALGGNLNVTTLRYPSSPYAEGEGETTEARAIAYCWDVRLVKRDSASGKALSGAVLRVTDDRGRHLAQDGTWTTADATVTTGSDGVVMVSGVDGGTFTVEEVSAPKGHTSFSGTRKLVLKVTGLDVDQVASAHPVLTVSAQSPLRADGVVEETSLATVSVLNDGAPVAGGGGGSGSSGGLFGLPKTGDTARLGIATALAAAGAALVVASRRRTRRSNDRR